jgi:multicomponent Na+:H+ antiporter subunit G
MNEFIATSAVIIGAALGVLSGVGLLRMPDVYIRLQVTSKASSLGIALLMLGVSAHFEDLSVTIRALLVVVFLFLTAPVAAHVIGRAAYITRVPMAPGTDPDELAGAYDPMTGRLSSHRHHATQVRPEAPPGAGEADTPDQAGRACGRA